MGISAHQRRTFGMYAILVCLPVWVAAAQGQENELFEKEIRPLFAHNCVTCHSGGKTAFAGLRLDSKANAMRGSDAGPVIVPGKPAESKLLKAVRGELPFRMPPSGPLKPAQIEALAKWIEVGAPWPEDAAAYSPAAAFDLEARKRAHWAWQPVRVIAPPQVQNTRWPLNPVDRFLLAKLEEKGLQPAPPADKGALLRRISFDLTGLPPSPADLERFENDRAPDAYEKVVDRLLDSPRYGERMARRWMDLIRYSESHGSEGDPDVPEAWRYRDYLIRSFNQDVPYDQLIREHLAGDLLPHPRLNAREGLNESLIGTAHFRMVEHGFQPVDPWEDRVKWTDNQIDVVSKAFQGMTISCARCHDHKFDAISQKDFYALFGIFYGARPTQVEIDAPAILHRNWDPLVRLKGEIRRRLAEQWRGDADGIAKASLDPGLLEVIRCDRSSPLYPLAALRNSVDTGEWLADWRAELDRRRTWNTTHFRKVWDLASTDYDSWIREGVGAPKHPSPAGEFAVEPQGSRVVKAIFPAGVYSGLLSRKHGAVISSPRFKIETDYISFRMMGGNYGTAQLIIEDYAVPRGGIYNHRYSPERSRMGWVQWDTTFWKGFTAYIEFATREELTHFTSGDSCAETDGRSWFGASQIVFHDQKVTPEEESIAARAVLDCPADGFAPCLQSRLSQSVEAWARGATTDAQAALLDYCLKNGLLANTVDRLPKLAAEYRRLENDVPVPRRAPGVLQEASPDQPLLVRGDLKNPGPPVPRRYLAALGGGRFDDPMRVRLRLAEAIVDPANPLTARVAVNRLWQYTFRRGIVRTVDNFGKLGNKPTHPELLDWLAGRFVEEGWSIKKMLRLLVTSQAYRMSSTPRAEARAADPANDWFHHMPLRRLEAEELRDAILSVSGRLDLRMYGPSVPVYYAHATGQTKGDRPKGPLDGDGRRSIYLEVRRNAVNPFLEVFDEYKPATTRGQRDVTNVPAQSLALMNSDFVLGQSEKCAADLRSVADPVETLYLRALGRKPSAREAERARAYAAESSLASLVQAVFDTKEFLYVQ